MKWLLVCLVLIELGLGCANAAPGDLDLTFGNGGVAVVGAPDRPLSGEFVALQPDGKIVVAGSTGCHECAASELVVARFQANGAVDTSFGDGGRRIIAAANLNVIVAVGVAIQPDGRIVVAGSSHPAAPPQFGLPVTVPLDIVLVRLLPSGALDPTFGTSGMVEYPLQYNDQSSFGAVALQGDGRVLAAGSIQNYTAPCSGISPCRRFLLAQFSAGGIPVVTFGGRLNLTGSVTTDFFNVAGGFAAASAMAIQSDGYVVVGGCVNVPGTSVNGAFALARYSPDGLLDGRFGSAGRMFTPLSDSMKRCDTSVRALAVQSDGKIIAVGETLLPSTCPPFQCRPDVAALVRYRTDGSLDTTFGSGGKVVTGLPSHDGLSMGLAIQPDGKVIVSSAGRTARYNTVGTLDTTFGVGGVASFSAPSLALQKTSLTRTALLVPGKKSPGATVPCSISCLSVERREAFTAFQTRIGTFSIAPAESVQVALAPFVYSFVWTVPDPENWRNLAKIALRIREGDETIAEAVFDATTDRFHLVDPRSGRPGPGAAAGNDRVLSTRDAKLHMDRTEVIAAGPTSPTVTLNLALELGSRTTGRSFVVEVAATDDLGNFTGFVDAGTLSVLPHRPR